MGERKYIQAGVSALLCACAAARAGLPSEIVAYWTEEHLHKLSRAPIPNGAVQDIVAGGVPVAIAVDSDGGRIFWSDTYTIERANLDGSNRQTIVSTSPNHAFGIALDLTHGTMYWTEFCDTSCTASQIRRAGMDGSAIQTLYTTETAQPAGIAIDVGAGKMYWTDFANKVYRANLDGTDVTEIWSSGANALPWAMAIDVNGGKIYWAERQNRAVRRANLDGSGAQLIGAGAQGIGIAIDPIAQKVYWTRLALSGPNTGAVVRANLDGSSFETVIPGLEGPSGLALHIATGPIPQTPAASTWGLLVLVLGVLCGGSIIALRRSGKTTCWCG